MRVGSPLDPAGPAARTIADLGWPLLVGFTAVSAIMWGLLIWVVVRRTGSFATHEPAKPGAGTGWVVLGGFVIPGVAFTAAFVATVGTLAGFPIPHRSFAPPEIRVTAHRWWWDVEYVTGALPQRFHTANELHVPVGRTVDIELVSADVIHSFWVPRLHGKVDLVPGTTNHIRIQASQAGTFEGSCAEFCGLQHAAMRFTVVAESSDDYRRWLAAQREPALATASGGDAIARGAAIFEVSACPLCHTVRGTNALATVGPELTHLASRGTLAAGWLPKNTATLHAWVMNAQSLKPGVEMPTLTQLTGEELHDLVAYLEALR
jgi:cytochrome c oxidase subunit 2